MTDTPTPTPTPTPIPTPLALDPDGKLPMSVTRIAGHLESTVAARWTAFDACQYSGLLGHWMGGRCSNERRLEVLTTLLDLGVTDLHPGLSVHMDVDAEDGRPVALLVSDPRKSAEIPISLSPRAFRIGSEVIPLEIDSAGRRAVEACSMAVARILAAPAAPDRRMGRRL